MYAPKSGQNKPSVISRRSFLLAMAAGGAGLIYSATPGGASVLAPAQAFARQATFEPNVWIRIDPDDTITITAARSEMGQGVRTSLAMIAADEMEADWSKIKIRQAHPNGGNGNLGTGGSNSIQSSYTDLRRAGATVRAMLVSAAAKTWNIPEADCEAQNGYINEKNGARKLSYGQLTDIAATIPTPSNPQLKSPSEFKLIGSPQPHIDNFDIVTGKAIYGLDVRIPNMKFAVSAMPPALGAYATSVDASEALKVPGVIKAENVNGVPGIVVVAESTFAALKGRDALKITWNTDRYKDIDSATISYRMKNGAALVEDVPANSAVKIQAEYELPYLAHATMEPMNCVADVRADKAEIWCPVQTPDLALQSASQASGLPANKIQVNTTLLGGGFGRRLDVEYVARATRISAAFKLPVLFMFTREDDMKNDNYRPASYHVLKGGLSADGKITGWIQKCAKSGSAENPPYQVPNPSLSFGAYDSPAPNGAWRSIGHNAAVFANESFIDELAAAAGKDPYQFRRDNLPAGRLRDVLDEAAARAQWTKPLPAGWGRGVAICGAYSYVAHAIEVSVNNNSLKVERVVVVVDCGVAVNPMGVEAQMQGACIDALSTALRAAITIENGAIKQSSFFDYQWLRIHEIPKIEVYIMPSSKSPMGIGEAGIPSVSPALCNAIFNATGKRIRKLPAIESFLSEAREAPPAGGGFLNLRPNPCSTSFSVEGMIPGATDEVRLTARDLLGNTIIHYTTARDANGKFSALLEFPPSAAGAYLLTAESAGHRITTTIVKI